MLLLNMPCISLAVSWKVPNHTHGPWGNIEADTISLISEDVTCRGGDPILTVIGKDISWYADPQKNTVLAKGNTYHSAPLDKTTTFYVTQKVNGIESAVQAITIEVVEAFLIDLQTAPAKCGKEDGTIMIKAKPGTDRYPVRFKLNDGPFQTASSFTGLAPGTYKLTLQVAKCTGLIDVEIGQQSTPTISNIDSVSPRCGKNDGSIRISAYGGNGSLSYSLNGVDFFTNNIFNDLSGGQYIVTVRDDSLCAVSQEITIKKSIALRLNSIDVHDTSCGQANGMINLGAAQGNGTLHFSVKGGQPQTSDSLLNLPAGNYDIIVTDEHGCSASESVTIGKSQGPIIENIDLQQPACNSSDGRITLSATGPGLVTFSLDSVNYQQEASFRDLGAADYVVTVKNDFGCTIQRSVKLDQTCGKAVLIPSAFTPNDDGLNDSWTIFFPFPTVEIEEITIFNRWGEVVLQSRPGNVSSGSTIWDGKYKGHVVRGVFAYKLLIKTLGQQQNYLYRGYVSAL